MRVPPETVYQTLFEFICQIAAPQSDGSPSLTPLQTKSRHWRPWDTVGSDAMPAFFQLQPPNAFRMSQNRAPGQHVYKLHASLFFYFAVDVDNFETTPSTTLNNYFTAIDNLLRPPIQSPGGSRQQIGLGPGVENVLVDGENIVMDEGLINPPAILLVPLTILLGA